MSGTDDFVAQARMMFCASCGKSELDGITLTECADCKSVRYCSDSCQQNHRPQHEVKCEEYRAAYQATVRDEILFRQPESTHLGDCPICCVPIPTDDKKSSMYTCCCKRLCNGCGWGGLARQLQANKEQTCPFCRQTLAKTREEFKKNLMKRIAANDPVAMRQLGSAHCGEGDYESAFKYLGKAAELGDVDAHFDLSLMYMKGQGVEKDEEKETYHLEEAAIAGHPNARHNLGCYEARKGRSDRAVKHLIIAANLGFDVSMKSLKEYYKAGLVSKEDFAAALRAYQVAIAATKSPQREAAQKYLNETKETSL